MVKLLFKTCLPLLLSGAFLICGCNVDIPGLVRSTDLDDRLKERDNFTFLNRADAPPLSLGDAYSFIVVTDTHIENGNTGGLDKLKAVIDSDDEIKFAVIVGDITQYGDAQDVRKFIEIADTLGVPCYPVIGNHDIYFANWSVWRTLIGSTCYRIDGDGTTLFFMDSANAFFGRDQLDWLQEELETAQTRIFVFSHANIFVEIPIDIQQSTDAKERARIVSILRNRGDAMFMGHVHRRIIKNVGNVQYITIEDYIGNRVYCRVSVTKTGMAYKFEKL